MIIKIIKRLINQTSTLRKAVQINKELSRPMKEPADPHQLSETIRKLSKANRIQDAIALTFNSKKQQSIIVFNELLRSINEGKQEITNAELTYKIFTEVSIQNSFILIVEKDWIQTQ